MKRHVSALTGSLLKSKSPQAGFTIIELVIVIVILGILAAVAIPRFVGLSADARKATVNGMYGSVLSAANLAHAVYLTANGSPSSITMEGVTVAMVNGYPAASADGIGSAVKDVSQFQQAANASSGWDFRASTAATPSSCMVTYVESSAPDTSPTVTATTTDCS